MKLKKSVKNKQLSLFSELENNSKNKRTSFLKNYSKRLSYRRFIRGLYKTKNYDKIKKNHFKKLKKAYKDSFSNFSVIKLRDSKKVISQRNKFINKKVKNYLNKNTLNDKVITYFLNLLNKNGNILHDKIVDLVEKKMYVFNSERLKVSFLRSGDKISAEGVDIRLKEYSPEIKKLQNEVLELHSEYKANIDIFKYFLESIGREKEIFKN
jgi:hypothetical protein